MEIVGNYPLLKNFMSAKKWKIYLGADQIVFAYFKACNAGLGK
jgi:hypothetical protein